MIGIIIGIGLFVLSLIINLAIPKKHFNEYPTEIIEEIPWSQGGVEDGAPNPIPQYFGVVKYKIEETELEYRVNIPSSEPNFDKKISFKRPSSLKYKNIYIFQWFIKVIGIIVLFVSLIIKLKTNGITF